MGGAPIQVPVFQDTGPDMLVENNCVSLSQDAAHTAVTAEKLSPGSFQASVVCEHTNDPAGRGEGVFLQAGKAQKAAKEMLLRTETSGQRANTLNPESRDHNNLRKGGGEGLSAGNGEHRVILRGEMDFFLYVQSQGRETAQQRVSQYAGSPLTLTSPGPEVPESQRYE